MIARTTTALLLLAWLLGCTGLGTPLSPEPAPLQPQRTPQPAPPITPSEAMDRSASPEGWVPDTHDIVLSDYGDLDLDGDEDAVLILERRDENPKGEREVWLVLENGGEYRMAAQNNEAAFCRKCGGVSGDPLSGITIAKGYFSIEHYGGSNLRWVRIFTFKHVDDHWELSRDGEEDFHTSNPDKVDKRSRTPKDFGVIRFEDFKVP